MKGVPKRKGVKGIPKRKGVKGVPKRKGRKEVKGVPKRNGVMQLFRLASYINVSPNNVYFPMTVLKSADCECVRQLSVMSA